GGGSGGPGDKGGPAEEVTPTRKSEHGSRICLRLPRSVFHFGVCHGARLPGPRLQPRRPAAVSRPSCCPAAGAARRDRPPRFSLLPNPPPPSPHPPPPPHHPAP